MSNWKRTSEERPNPLENVLFLSINGHVYFGWRSENSGWYVSRSDFSMPNSMVKAWCPIPGYDLND